MDNKEKKVLEEAGLLYPTPNCVEYYQIVKATADEVVQRIFEAMSDSVQVVRCKDCKWGTPHPEGDEYTKCLKLCTTFFSGHYCAWGERRGDDVVSGINGTNL